MVSFEPPDQGLHCDGSLVAYAATVGRADCLEAVFHGVKAVGNQALRNCLPFPLGNPLEFSQGCCFVVGAALFQVSVEVFNDSEIWRVARSPSGKDCVHPSCFWEGLVALGGVLPIPIMEEAELILLTCRDDDVLRDGAL